MSPLSVSIDVVTRNSINNMNEMSAVDDVLSCGTILLRLRNMGLAFYFRDSNACLTYPATISATANSSSTSELTTNISAAFSQKAVS